MWTLKLRIPYLKKALISRLAKKYKIAVVGYPLSGKVKKDSVYITGFSYLQGNPRQCKGFTNALKKDRRLIHLEQKENCLLVEVQQHQANALLFQSGIFPLKPYIVNSQGEYIFEIGSWERETLANLIQEYKKAFNAAIISFKRRTIAQIQTINVYPSVTPQQKKCLDLAVQYKYYDYPRRITLKELAKKAGLSYSTYQFHLQNAEKKVMPTLSATS